MKPDTEDLQTMHDTCDDCVICESIQSSLPIEFDGIAAKQAMVIYLSQTSVDMKLLVHARDHVSD